MSCFRCEIAENCALLGYYTASQFCSTVGPPTGFPTTISCPFVSFTSISTVFFLLPVPLFIICQFLLLSLLLPHFQCFVFSPSCTTQTLLLLSLFTLVYNWETTSPLCITVLLNCSLFTVLLNCSLFSSHSSLSFPLSFSPHYFPWSPGPEWGNFTMV